MKKKLPSLLIGNPMKRLALGSALALVMLLTPAFVSGQPQLIRDINTQANALYNEYTEVAHDGMGTLYFVSEGNLYRSNTNTLPQTTSMIRNLSTITDITVAGTNVFFVGEDGAGKELWKTNGTGATTRKVKEIRAGAAGSNPQDLVTINGVLYFSANDGTSGRELWKSDGTEAGTVRIKDIYPGAGSGSPSWITEMNGIAYFSAYDPTRGENLWKSDGTPAGTVLVSDIRSTNDTGEGPEWITNANGTLFFSAEGVSTGVELWKSDGTKAGTKLVKDIRPGAASSGIREITAMNGSVYFSATGGSNGLHLWRSDGATTSIVTTLLQGETTDPNDPTFYFTSIGNYLYYLDYYNGRIMLTDGTPDGTRETGNGFHLDDNPNFTERNGQIFYLAITFDGDEYANHLEFRRMQPDGTQNTLIKSFAYALDFGAEDPRPSGELDMAKVNVTFYFPAMFNKNEGWVLAKSGGTPESTQKFYDAHRPTLSSDPDHFAVLNGQTFFSSGGPAMKVWRTDGTSEGTIMLQDMEEVVEIRTIGNAVYFAGLSHDGLLQIWKTNGTTAGTILLKEYGDDYQYWNQNLQFTDVNGTVYFTPGHGQLWKSDGTPSGTQMLKVFQDIEWIGTGGGRAIFRVRTIDNTTELWRSSGTTNSTAKLRNMHADATTTSITHPRTTVNNVLYFAGDGGNYQHELWRSDGTTSGTYMVKEISPPEAPHLRYTIKNLFSHNDTLYIAAGIQQSNNSLFKSDGTSSGTVLVAYNSILNHYVPYGNRMLVVVGSPGNAYVALYAIEGNTSYHIKTLELEQLTIFFYTIVNNVVFFTYGRGLWRTDGTECGTQPIAGTTEVYPLVSNGQYLVFGARHPDFGREPYRMSALSDPGNPCGTDEIASASSFGAATFSAASQVVYGPNPFTSDITFRINGNDGETAAIQVTNFMGEVVETIPNVTTNTDYQLGAHWPKGIYVIKATANGKTEMIRVVRK